MTRWRLHPAGPRRELLVDAVMGAALTTLLSVTIMAGVFSTRQADAGAYLFAIGLGILVLLRRRAPVVVLVISTLAVVVYYALGYPVIGQALPLSVALYSAAAAGRLRAAAVVVAAYMTFSVWIRIVEQDDPSYLTYDTLATILMMTAFLALGDATRSKRLLRDETWQRVRLAERQRQHEAEQWITAERVGLARDLHDSLSHSISVIALHTQVAQESGPDLPARTQQALTHVRRTADTALDELRSTVSSLRGRDLQAPRRPLPGLADLPALVNRMDAAGLQVSHRTEGTPHRLPPIIDTTAYRVAQEALTNCLRHAGPARADLVVTFHPGAVEIGVADNGTNSGPHAPACGNGMLGMRDRVELIGGSLAVRPESDRGFHVHARLPVGPA